MYLQKGTDEAPAIPSLGYSFLGKDRHLITQNIYIDTYRNYEYFNKRYLQALNAGTITQEVYDAIINNQTEARIEYEINGDISVSTSELEALIDSREDISREGGETAAELVQLIIEAGYEIIKKI